MKNADARTALEPYLVARRAEIEAALDAYLPSSPATPEIVASAMRYSVVAGGKRLRPVLTLAAADAVGGEVARALAMPAACAIEMIHTYSLIHDDLPAMDDDTLRRGRPTLHVVAGDGMAILAGDGLQAEAFRLMAREPVSDDPAITRRKLRVIDLVADAAGPRGMVGGQAIDLHAVRPGPGQETQPLSAEDVEQMHARKTGAIIRASALAGAVMAGAAEQVVTAVAQFATAIGLAFQIIDDVLDVEAASETLGKTAGKDAAAGKPTYPSIFGIARSRQLADECLQRADRALASVGLEHSQLAAIGHWIVARNN
jgi:geranylgeranyl diphosphate synthase type II